MLVYHQRVVAQSVPHGAWERSREAEGLESLEILDGAAIRRLIKESTFSVHGRGLGDVARSKYPRVRLRDVLRTHHLTVPICHSVSAGGILRYWGPPTADLLPEITTDHIYRSFTKITACV